MIFASGMMMGMSYKQASTDESVQIFSHYWVVLSTCSTDAF